MTDMKRFPNEDSISDDNEQEKEQDRPKPNWLWFVLPGLLGAIITVFWSRWILSIGNLLDLASGEGILAYVVGAIALVPAIIAMLIVYVTEVIPRRTINDKGEKELDGMGYLLLVTNIAIGLLIGIQFSNYIVNIFGGVR